MHFIKLFQALLILLIGASLGAVSGAEKLLSEKEKIDSLIKNVEALKDAAFIRNDREYDAGAAAKFLRSKWQSQEKQIKTAADFIEKVASVSSTSGKPYVIRFKDRREMKCGEYLKSVLKKIEEPAPPAKAQP